MAAPISGTATDATGTSAIDAPGLNYFVFALFFIFGGITSLNDVILPKLKELFTLNYTQAMLIQFCFFTAYLVIGIPGAQLVKKIGYMRGAIIGLLTMTAGCLLFVPASNQHLYVLFLLALFVLASGVVVVQVVTNPLISLLGPQKTVHSRLTFAQAFNSLGTVLFPLLGSFVIVGGIASLNITDIISGNRAAFNVVGAETVKHLYVGIAAAIALIAAVFWFSRNKLAHGTEGESTAALTTLSRYMLGIVVVGVGLWQAVVGSQIIGVLLMLVAPAIWLFGNALLSRARFSFGALCIFLYVGAEVAIGSLIVNYLSQAHVLNISTDSALPLVSFYWFGAFVGRIIGSYFLRMVSPGLILAACAAGAITLLAISTNTTGTTSGYSLLAIGLMNSIMFPTIFSLACEKLGSKAADGSGIINIAIFGGAVIPLLTGMLADASGSLATAMILPAICYAVILAFGFYARRPA